MIRAIGIDPGTISFDVCGLAGQQRLFLDLSLPTADVSADPGALIDRIQEAGPVDMIVGPSGYGLPWVRAQDLTARDIDLAIGWSPAGQRAATREHRGTIIGGMRGLLRGLQALSKERDLPIHFAPGVIHLATVPAHRKVNRIDMGTADKLCAVTLGVYDQARRLEIEYQETAFIYVELGGAFTAIIAVKGGLIVDGIGGTSGPLGYLAAGAMDGELAYLLGGFHKGALCSGGAAYVAGDPGLSPEELIDRAETPAGKPCQLAWDAFIERLVKGVAAMLVSAPNPREILLSGRLCHIPAIRWRVEQALEELAAQNARRFTPVQVTGFTSSTVAKEAAQGAALIANGLAGGVHADLIDAMRLREANGTILDHLYIAGADKLHI